MRRKYRIFTINPGSTSTKVALFENRNLIFKETISHSPFELQRFKKIWNQYEYRKKGIINLLIEKDIKMGDISGVVGRGGLFKPLKGGTYIVDDNMIADARSAKYGEHAANLGCVLAYGIAWKYNTPAYVVDPPSVDEMIPLARYSGMKELPRRSIVHALNIHATARMAASAIKKDYKKAKFVVAHLGGGMSITAVEDGEIVDCSLGLSGGPFTPERAGALPVIELLELAHSKKYTFEELKKRIIGGGGLVSYLNTNDAKKVEERIKAGDKYAEEVYKAMAFQIAKEIASMAAVLKGNIDSVVLTGGLAYSEMLLNWVKKRVSFLGKIMVYPGEDEMQALALGALRVLRGEEEVLRY